MKLSELLARDRVVVPLEAETLEAGARRLVQAIAASDAVRDADELRARVEAALAGEVVTAGGALLVHCRTDAVTRSTVALGVAQRPLGGPPGKEGRIVVLIVSPPKDSSAHLQAVGTFGRALSRAEVTEALLAAKTPDDVLDAAPLGDIELPGHLTVRDVMVRRQLSVRPEAPLGEAAQLMVAHGVPALPVVSEGQEVLGMVTHRELLKYLLPLHVKRLSSGEFRAAARGDQATDDPHQIPVRDVMDRSVLCVSEDQTVADVATMMLNRNVDRFPVVREGGLVGFLTRGDIVRRLLGP